MQLGTPLNPLMGGREMAAIEKTKNAWPKSWFKCLVCATKPAQLQRHSITRSLEASISENGSEDDSKTASRQL
jgi:hypothetical protein